MYLPRYSGTGEKIDKLEKELESARKQSMFDRETARAELSRHRQSHYGVLSQLQVTKKQIPIYSIAAADRK